MIHTIIDMFCTWFPGFRTKNPKWSSKEPILGRQKIFSNRVEFGLKMIAATRRSRFIQYLLWFVHDFQRFGPKSQIALQGANFKASKNSVKSRRVWAQNYRGNAWITIHTIFAMICTWFSACWFKNPKWPSKEPILGLQKSVLNQGEFGLKMIASTRRSRFIQY